MLTEELRSTGNDAERRRKPRINIPFRTKVEGVDDQGQEFSTETVLDNISGNGLYLRMIPCVEEGAKLSIVVQLHRPSYSADDAPRFSIDGKVNRAEKKAGGACGVAVTFDHVRFL